MSQPRLEGCRPAAPSKLVLTLLILLGSGAPQPLRAAPLPDCKLALLEPTATGLAPELIELAVARVSERLVAAGCTLVERRSVAAMRKLLTLPERLDAAQTFQLGKSLMVRAVITLSLVGAGQRVDVEVASFEVAEQRVRRQSQTVPAAELLPTLVALTAATVEAAPASQPTSAPAAAPASRAAAAPAPARRKTPPAPVVATPVPLRKRPYERSGPMGGAGMQTFYLPAEGRAGITLDVELGAIRPLWRGGLLLRLYPGDTTSYMLGARAQGGPGWGRLELAFGVDLGLIFVPGNEDTLDLMLLSLQALGGAIHWRHVRLGLDLFRFDLYLTAANAEQGREAELLYGFSHGLTVSFH